MKRILEYIFLILILALAAGCRKDIGPTASGNGPQLSVQPRIFSERGLTKVEDTDPGIVKDDEVAARDELRENFFGSLDIFVKLKDASASDAWFKEYHLNAGDEGVIVDPDKYDSESLLDKAKQALSANWAEEGYEPGVPYDIYVTANNPHTAAGSAPSNLSGLQALTTNSPDIFRYYLTYTPPTTDPIYYSNCMYSEKKQFLMDGSIEGWTIDPDKTEQVFDVDLKRAAAKVIVTVKFSDEKNMALVAEPTASNPNPEPEKDAYGRVVYGSIKEYMAYVGRTAGEPRWKPVNFCLEGSDIAYTADPLPQNQALFTADGNYTIFKEGDSSDNTDNSFALVSYTYPVDWSADDNRAPYVLLSVFYTRDSDGDQLRSYYRIPVCDETTVTSLDRNHIYIVDVEIASLGASNEAFDAKDEELRIEYHVVPWTETNMAQEATTVKISDTKYLTVIPTEYTLKGDGNESVDLQWYASVSVDDNRIVDIDPSSLAVSYVNYLGVTTDIKGTVTKQVRNDSGTLVTATDANTDGKRDIVITSTAPDDGAMNEKIVITLTPNGILRVESEALASRAVKDISFTVYLKNSTGVDAVPITIRHFPLDNIQSITGSWSSKWDGTYEEKTITDYTSSLEQANAWGSYTTQTNPSVSYDDYIAYSGSKTNNGATTTLSNADIAAIFGVTNNNQRNANAYAKGANSLETAMLYNGKYYWVTRTGTYNYTYTYYVADTFRLTGTVYSRTRTANVASTGSWVDWEYHSGSTNYDDIGYYAKVYADGHANMINTDAATYDVSNMSNLTNRQMYVIQLTSTSNTYAIGRPVLDGNYQSQDNVCSPAFMIASQLGATTQNRYTGATAAEHCGTYMEVGTDGTRYTGWRLPTRSEIDTIIKYQTDTAASYGVTMIRVLAGQNYWALDGNTRTAYASGTAGTFVRCVRDLSADEIKKLNKED